MAYNPAAMQIDAEAYKKLIVYMADSARKMDTEILAHRLLVEAIRSLLPNFPFEEFLQEARTSPAMKDTMSKKYDGFVAQLLEKIDAAKSDQELAEFLSSWTPKGPAN